MDTIIRDKREYVFRSSDSQFGFKSEHSTSQCTFVMDEIIEYYNSNGSPALLVELDASRAFDKVEYCKLFQLLTDRIICALFESEMEWCL